MLSCQLLTVSASEAQDKTYLVRLNHLTLLHVHKDLTTGMDIVEINLLVEDNNRCRHEVYGKFSKFDLPMKSR